MDRKKFLVIGLLSLFMISMFAGIVSAQEETVGSNLIDDVTDIFSGGFDNSSDTGVAISRFLMIILIVLLVYSVSGAFPFIGDSKSKGFIQWGISIVVAILSFMFLDQETIRALLINYEALGVMLTTVIPLIILIVFIIQLDKDNPFTAHIISPILTIGFIVYIAYMWFDSPIGGALRWVYPITLGGLIAWLIWYRRILKKIGIENVKSVADKYEEESKKAKKKTEIDAETFEHGSGI